MGFLGLFGRASSTETGTALGPVTSGSNPAGRRDRGVDAGAVMVADTLGTKLLHGWLQNRHQTLLPLNLNLQRLSPAQREGLATILATVLLAGRPAEDADGIAPTVRAWFAGLGADADTLASFDGAMTTPLPLNVLFDIAQERDLTTYAYVAALVTSDPAFPVSVMLCDMIQARFDLPSAMVRSAIRRYRR